MKNKRMGIVVLKSKPEGRYKGMWNNHKADLLERMRRTDNQAIRCKVMDELIPMLMLELQADREEW